MLTLSLVLGLIGSGFFIASCASTNRKHILVFGVFALVADLATYALKGDFATMALVVIAVARNSLYLRAGTSLPRRRLVWAGVSLATIVAWSLMTDWTTLQWWTPMSVIGSLLLVAALASTDIVRLKALQVLNGVLWLVYELMSGAYTVMIGESVGLVLAAVALLRLTRARKTNPSDSTVLDPTR
jgi:hypothetical protein